MIYQIASNYAAMLDGKPRILSKPEGVLASDCQANHKIYRGRNSKTRQDKTRQDKTRQDKTRQLIVKPE
jgi:hypothetical protein